MGRTFNRNLVRKMARVAMVAPILFLFDCGGGSVNTVPITDPGLTAALRQDLSTYLSERSSIEHISTLSMTVSLRGQPDINLAVGTTQYGGGVPVTPLSLFQIGSNTKSFTAAIMLQLEAAGILSIDDTVGKWLPQYPAWSGATIRQLLNMTGGIPTYDATPAWERDYSSNPFAQSTTDQLTAYVYPTANTPGSAWLYSNTGYILAQQIIDKASPSKSFETEIDRLIASVGLKNTFYQPYFYPAPIMSRLVSGYEVNSDDPGLAALYGRDTSTFSLGWTQAAGGVVANPEDLTIWVRALFEGQVLPQKQLGELSQLAAIPGGQPIAQTTAAQPQGFGLGIFQLDDPTMGRFWGYQGSTIGYRAAYAYLLTSGAIVCVFTNSQAAAAVSTVNSVLFEKIYATLRAAGKI